MVEQPDTLPQQNRYQIYVYLLEQTRPDALLHDARCAHGYVLLSGDLLGLLYGALDAVGDEGERRSLVDPFLGDRMGNHEARHAQGRTATPSVGDVEGPAPRHKCPHLAVRLSKDLGALGRDLEYHLGTRQPVFGVAAGVP